MLRRTATVVCALLILVGIAVAVPRMTSADSSEVPSNSPRLLAASSLGVGGAHTCVAKDSGTVSCWGLQTNGRLGNGQTSGSSPVPSQVSGLSGVKAISSGSEHGCALLVEGTVRCWGRNDFRHLGDGTITERSAPVRVLASGTEASSPVELTGVTAISVGGGHACGLMLDGTVKCWGNNGSRQLGNTGPTAPDNTVTVPGISGAIGLATGHFFSCALLSTGAVRCWGNNANGQLGDGTTTARTAPVRVLASGTEANSPVELTNVIAISANLSQACALMANGSVRCWGSNTQGQLGDGTTTNRLNPVRVLASGTETGSPVELTGIAAINASGLGSSHACTLMIDTSMRCWGLNAQGQLGIGTTASPRPNPEQVLTSLGGPTLLGAGVTTTTTTTSTTTTTTNAPSTTIASAPTTTTKDVEVAATITASTIATGPANPPSTTAFPSDQAIRSLETGEIVSKANVEAGSFMTVNAGGFAPGEGVSTGIAGMRATLVSTKADSSGKVAARISVPSNAKGQVTVFALGQESKRGFRQVVNVTSPAELPKTGSNSEALLLLATSLMAAGLLGGARRRLSH